MLGRRRGREYCEEIETIEKRRAGVFDVESVGIAHDSMNPGQR